MKRLILYLVLILLSVTMVAQVRTAVTKSLRPGATYYKYTGVTADTLSGDTLYFQIFVNKHVPVTCNARAEVTRAAGAETLDIDLEGKIFENDSWSKIVETATNAASISLYEPNISLVDSTGVPDAISGNTDNFYRYFRVFTGATDGTVAAGDYFQIDYIIFKIYKR